MERIRKQRWLIMCILCAGCVSAYAVPYLVRSYYSIFQQATGLTDTQLGLLMTMYGTGGIIFYFPGGWLADRINPRILLLISYIGSGLLAFVLLLKPAFSVLLIVYFLFAVTSIGTLWGALIKLVRSLAEDKEQGKLFSSREYLYGIFGLIIGFGAQWIGTLFPGNELATFNALIIGYGVIAIVSGVVLYLILGEEYDPNLGEPEKIDLASFKTVAKMKEVWLVAAVVFTAYVAYSTISYTGKYLKLEYGMSAEMETLFGTIRSYGIRCIVPFFFGLWIDKSKSSAKVLQLSLVASLVCLGAYLVLPKGTSLIAAGVAIMIALTAFTTGARAAYYPQLAEIKVPQAYTGIATGIVAVLAYTPDAFLYLLAGHWIDTYGSKGYTMLFGFVAALLVAGIAVSAILIKSIKAKKAQ